jgi:hypothetical protein
MVVDLVDLNDVVDEGDERGRAEHGRDAHGTRRSMAERAQGQAVKNYDENDDMFGALCTLRPTSDYPGEKWPVTQDIP